MIEIEELNYKYKNETEALKKINITIKEGEVISIIGKKGSGKSKRAKLIAGIIKPSSRISFNR